jgi:hypothetical protein
LRAVAEYWDDIIRLADEEQRARLRALVAGTAEPDPVEARAALADLLLDVLPPDHPIIRVMQTVVMFSAGTTFSGARQADALRWLREQVDAIGAPEPEAPGAVAPATAAAGPEAAADLDEFDELVRGRLLRLPSLTADEVRGMADPDDKGLIRLAGPDRQVRLPAFQFTPDGRPWPVVREVNARLGAAADPWGVACWWVDPHQRLAASPADLLGRDSDDLLRWAAALVGEE